MALISLGESRWRMLRRAIKTKRFTYKECRNQTRHDQEHFEWLLEKGFFVKAGEDTYEVTHLGKQSADLGFYEV